MLPLSFPLPPPCFSLPPPCFTLLPPCFPRHAHRHHAHHHHAHRPLLVTQAVESVHGALPYFRKAEPAWLQLPGYTPSELAAMSHQLLTAAGYSLPVVPARDATSLLQQAICATWPATHRTYELPLPPLRLTAAALTPRLPATVQVAS